MTKDESSYSNRILFIMILNQIANGTLYLNIITFFPVYVKDNYNYHINTFMVSICLAMNELAGIFGAGLNQKTISKLGRKNSVLMAYMLLILSTASMGFIDFIDKSQYELFYVLACLIRFIQGYADSLAITTQYSLIGLLFTENKQIYFGYMEAAIGLGLVIGPPLGSLTYGLFGYQMTFYISSIILIFSFLSSWMFLPSKLNQSRVSNNPQQISLLSDNSSFIQNETLNSIDLSQYQKLKKSDLSFLKLLSIKPVFFSLFAGFVSFYCITNYNSYLSLQLLTYGVEKENLGYCFLIQSSPYMPSCLLVPIVLKNVPKKIQFILCFILCSIAFSLMGPSELLGFPDQLQYILVGMFLMGSSVSLSFTNSIPEAIDQVIVKYKVIEGLDEEMDGLMNDSISSLYQGIFVSFAGLICPIYGGFMYDYAGYKTSMDISMFILIIMALIYYYFNDGTTIYFDFNKQNKDLKELKKLKKEIDMVYNKQSQINN